MTGRLVSLIVSIIWSSIRIWYFERIDYRDIKDRRVGDFWDEKRRDCFLWDLFSQDCLVISFLHNCINIIDRILEASISLVTIKSIEFYELHFVQWKSVMHHLLKVNYFKKIQISNYNYCSILYYSDHILYQFESYIRIISSLSYRKDYAHILLFFIRMINLKTICCARSY